MVLDVALRAEDQRLGALARLEVLEIWVVRLCSQDSRSGPVIRTTPRCERSAIPVPAASARCSA